MDEAELIQRQRDREKRLRDAILKDEFGEASSVLDDANFGGVVADKVGFLRAGALAEWTRPLVGNQPLNPASPDWQGIKDGVTRNYFKKPNAAGVTDQQFHELVKADIQTRDSALEKARNDALAGIGLVTGLSAFSQGAAQSPVKGKFFTYQGEYQKAYSQVSQRVEPYRDTINEASRILSSELDREVADVEAFRKVADMLIAVPEKDRPIVLNAIGVTGGLATGDTKAYSEKLFASFDRMLGSLAAGGESLFESVATSVGLTEAAAGLAPADTEAAFQTEARRREYDILKNMVRQTAYGEVSPVQGDGWLEETGIGLAAMAPLTVAAFVPYAGQAAMVGYFRDDTAANLMRDNPGMTAAQADSIATVAAPFMAAVETVANKIPFGKVPAVEQFFRSQVTSLKTAATRFGARTALGTGAEIAEEGAQQMLPVAFQELATALNADIPGVDWGREVERLKEMPAQVFGPALVMSMIGAGGVSIAEVRNGRALAQNVDLLVANGNSPEQAQRIVEAGQKQDWAQVDAIIRDGFSKPQATPEQRQAAIQSFTSKIDKTQAAVKSLEVNGQIASIRRAADGWALIGIDGTQTAKFQSFEEADGARWADAKQRNLNLHAAMREYITQMDSRLGENQENIIRFNPEKLTGEMAVERGMVTQQALDARIAAMRALDQGKLEEKEYAAATAEAQIEGDDEPVITFLGTNYLEFKDGVSRGVIDLYQGATLHDLVEEMAEVSVKRLGVRKNKSKLIADLRDAEAKIQEVERRMGDEPSLLFRSANDAELTDADVIEAFSHVAKSYFTNEALRSDTAKGWQAKNKNTRRYLTQLRKGVTESGAFRWIQLLGRKLGSIFQRASAIDAVRGQFKGDLETLIRQAVGLDSQDTFDQQTIEEAQTLAREAGVGGEVSMSVTAEEDSAYLAAVERGDMETAQRMVDEAAKAAGYDTYTWYHGGTLDSEKDPIPRIKEGKKSKSNMQLDFGLHLAKDRNESLAYARSKNGRVNAVYLAKGDGLVLDLSNDAPWIVTSEIGQKFGSKISKAIEKQRQQNKAFGAEVDIVTGEVPVYPAQIEPILTSLPPKEVYDALRSAGYSGVQYTAKANYGTGWYRTFEAITVIGSPNQVKLADPVTYDDAGNVIPLSQRFNPERPEITFSLTKGDLQTRLAAMFDPFQRDPVMRRKIGLAAAQRVQKVAREALFSVAGSGVNKNTMERLEAERLKALSKMKDDAPDWVKKRLQTPTTPEQVRAEVQKDRLLGWLRTLNAAVSSLPLEVRSRILQGGTMKIASLKSNEARLRAVEEIIKKADRHLEAYLRKEITAEIDKLTERYKSTRKDAGQMAGKLISTATEQVDYLAAFRDLDEKQQEDTIAALEKTIEEDDNADSVQDALNKLGIAELFFNEQKQSAEQLNNALEWLQSTIELGRQGKKVLDEERKQFIGSLKTAALDSVLAGDEASLIAAENKDANVSATTLKKSVDLLKGIYYEVIPTTLQQLEMTFGEDSAIANHFRDRIIEATNQATDIKRKIERDRVQAMAEIFGTKSGIAQVIAMKRLQKVRKSGVMVNEGRKTEDMRLDADILQRLSDGAVQAADLGLTEAQVADALDEFAANPRTRGVTIEKVTNAGKMVELEMSEAQGIQYLFSWNQPDVQERMRRQGWDESTIAQLNEFLSPEAKALAAWMSEQYAQGADLIDPVYRRLFNAPMPRNKNYAPTFYNVSGSANVTPLDAGQQSSGISAGFTKARRAHNAPLKRVDSLVAFLSHWEHVSHWVAFSELVRDMKAVLADNTVQAAIATKISRPAADKLKTRIKSIESQGNNQAWALFAMDGFFARLNQARAFKGLAYRISPIIKQTSAILNPLLADVPAPAYFMRLGKLLTGNLDVSAMWRSDAINRRIDSGFSPEFRMAQQGAGVNGSVAVALMQRGMLPMSYTDAGWNTLGAAIAFDYYRSQAIKSMGDNVNMEAAEAAATKAVDRMLAVAAQPSELVNRALVEGSPNPFTKAAWMFASESRKTLAIELAAINRLIKGKSKNKAMDVQRIMVAHFLMGAVTQLMSGFYSFLLGDEEDREREWSSEQWAAALLSGPINGLFVLGDVMGMLVRRAVGAEVWQASGSALMKAANDFWRGAANIDDLFSDDPEEIKAEIDRLSGAMGTITAGLVGPQAMALDVVLGNPLRDIEKARKRVTEEE